MKNLTIRLILFIYGLFVPTLIWAQQVGNGNIVARSIELPFFNAIEAGGIFDIVLVQTGENRLIIETDENLLPLVDSKVEVGTLKIRATGIQKATKMQVTVLFNELNLIELSGVSKARSDGSIVGDMLAITCSGASSVDLSVAVNQLQSNLSGVAVLTLAGKAVNHAVEMSGAAQLRAANLTTVAAVINASGASNAMVNVSDLLTINTTGAARVRYDKQPARLEVKNQNAQLSTPQPQSKKPSADTVSITVGNINIKVLDGDSTVVEIGDRKLVVDQKGSVALKRKKANRFNGHWAGIELGLNGYLTPNFSFDMPSDYLDLMMEKSVVFNLNFYEQNIPLNKNKTFGIVSGLGLTWNNYRLDNYVLLEIENKRLRGYHIQGVNMKKSKLVNTWLTVPLMFEWQTNSGKRKEKAHLAAGLVAGWRFSSHAKLYFGEANKAYTLTDEMGNLVQGTRMSPGASRRNIVKDYNSFQQNPFKLDASLRAGWGMVNFFANYSVVPMFINNRGPELYPFAVGITLTSF